MAPVVAILGGGAYVARLVELIGASRLPPVEIRIHARDRDRLAAIAHHAAGRLAATAATGRHHQVRGCPELDDALAGATAVVLLVRVGGLAARAHDESFPARFDQVGDEGVGLGGMANAWRTLPILETIASQIVRQAPSAHVLNLMAPLGVTTRLLVERGLRAIGLCELPTVTLARWQAAAGGAPPALHYAGLNHLGFFWCPAMPALEHPVIRAALAERHATAELVARFDAVPLHYFIDVFEPELARSLGRQRRAGRAAELAALQTVLNPLREKAERIREAVAVLDQRQVDFESEGEMQADVALDFELMRRLYPFSRLKGPANILVMPALHSANISAKLMQQLGGTVIGPVLMGLSKPAQIVQAGATVSDLLTAAALAGLAAVR